MDFGAGTASRGGVAALCPLAVLKGRNLAEKLVTNWSFSERDMPDKSLINSHKNIWVRVELSSLRVRGGPRFDRRLWQVQRVPDDLKLRVFLVLTASQFDRAASQVEQAFFPDYSKCVPNNSTQK